MIFKLWVYSPVKSVKSVNKIITMTLTKLMMITYHFDSCYLIITCIDRSEVNYLVECLNSEYSISNGYDGHGLDNLDIIFNYNIYGDAAFSKGI